MKLLQYITALFLCVFTGIYFQSCSDDLEYRNTVSVDDAGEITICIPDAEWAAEYSATRSDEFRATRAVSEVEEGGITTLWFFAYPADNTSGATTKITQLTGHASLEITGNSTGTGYKEYKVNNFAKGNYRIYLLANFDNYLDEKDKFSTTTSEDQLKALILNFSTDKRLIAGDLPMYCLPTQIKKTSIGGPVDPDKGIFNIDGSSNIYADLNFLCSKIRFTVLFDRTESGFSNQYSSDDINFSDAYAMNVRKQSDFLGNAANEETIAGKLPANRFNPVAYPTDPNSLYFSISNSTSTTSPDNLSRVTGWTNNSKRAWQGVFYLPENKLQSKDAQTKIYLTPNGGSEMESQYSFTERPLLKGQMYDLVAKMKKGDIEMDMSISDWTLMDLVYKLHGNYSLTVQYSDIEIASGRTVALGYKTDTYISFDIPEIKYKASDGVTYDIPFYVAEFIDNNTLDEDGNPYPLSTDYPSYFRIGVNSKLPFVILYDLMTEKQYTDADGVVHTLESLGYFHVVAGNLHKKITTRLNLAPYLNVSPKLISIDTRDYYLSANDEDTSIEISFDTNYDLTTNGVDFYMSDPSGLVEGLGKLENGKYDLSLGLCVGVDTESHYDIYYPIVVTNGVLSLNLSHIIGGHEFWSSKRELTLTFTINVRNPHTNQNMEELKLEETVRIIIKPYTTNYIIHFYDKTHTWAESTHIFVYQDLLLPADLSQGFNNDNNPVDATDYAGKIVGYVEWWDGGQQYNAAAQYVFSNNISFRGWSGYGGPSLNNPYDIYPDYMNNDGYSRQGFVMLGKPNGRSTDYNWTWNDSYGYTNRAPDERFDRYRYDVNFNKDHADRVDKSTDGWKCDDCLNRRNNDYMFCGDNGGYDYPGIVMEKEHGENEGWWRYTLTGVAQPGKTMIIFADTKTPWSVGNNVQDDHRFPAAYETGLTLFDFEDNEGWFVFNGRNIDGVTNTESHFYDEKPEI